jgi:hypothetical protein
LPSDQYGNKTMEIGRQPITSNGMIAGHVNLLFSQLKPGLVHLTVLASF